MSIVALLHSLFATPTIASGARVNQVHRGNVQRSDGYVIAHNDDGVLVEWPRGGSSVVSAAQLAVIA
jgi:hypothetical protein